MEVALVPDLGESVALDFTWAAVGYTVALTACYGASRKLTLYDQKDGHLLENPTAAERLDVADHLLSWPFFMLITASAFTATAELHGSVADRWHSSTQASYLCLMLYVTRQIWHIPVQWVYYRSSPKLQLQMTAHHILSSMALGNSLATGRMQFWGAAACCCEVSNIFLNGVFAFKFFTSHDEKYLYALRLFTGGGLVICFIAFRLALFPTWLWWFYKDIFEHGAETWELVTWPERLCPLVIVLLLLLSAAWTRPITKGFLKLLYKRGSHKARKTE